MRLTSDGPAVTRFSAPASPGARAIPEAARPPRTDARATPGAGRAPRTDSRGTTGEGGSVVRALQPGDEVAVRRLFRDTLCLGRPLPFEVPEWDAYESLCLDWYLGPGRGDAGVLVDGGNIRGYALVCTDAPAHQRWQHVQAAHFTARVARRLVTGTIDPDAGRFLRLRLRDGWDMWRHTTVAPLPAHAHLNLASSSRAGLAGWQLAGHVDRRCQQAGLPGWYGEMNAVAGHRARALERLGATVVRRAPNHTLTWLLGQPVERLTVARWAPAPRCVLVDGGALDPAAVVA